MAVCSPNKSRSLFFWCVLRVLLLSLGFFYCNRNRNRNRNLKTSKALYAIVEIGQLIFSLFDGKTVNYRFGPASQVVYKG